MKTLFVLTLSSMVIVLGFMVATIILDGKQNTRLDALEGWKKEAVSTVDTLTMLSFKAADYALLDAKTDKAVSDCLIDSLLSIRARLDSLAAVNRNQTEAIKQLQKEKQILRGGR